MDQILSDQYHDKARAFIQEHVKAEFLTRELKDKLIELYNSLTIENGKYVYDTATKLYNDAAHESTRQFNLSCLKFAGTGILIGGSVSLVGYLGSKITNQNSVTHNMAKCVLVGGGAITLLSTIFLFSIGH